MPFETFSPETSPSRFKSPAIVAARGPKNSVDTTRPFAMHVEREFCASGVVEDVATLFLTNRECLFDCLMCDLWKNTTNERVPNGAIPEQIRFAQSHLPSAQHIKLYNSGNFFDPQAIPPQDFREIAKLVSNYKTVIVENHPKLCNENLERFQDLCETKLEVAMGLETSHAPTLHLLNKQMTTDDFKRACELLLRKNIRIRSFILLKPPRTSEIEGVQRAIESVQFAINCGVNCCVVIPTRPGNGIMDQLIKEGDFAPPIMASLESVFNETLSIITTTNSQNGCFSDLGTKEHCRVFVDIWDAKKFSRCQECESSRIERLVSMNLTQKLLPPIECRYCECKGVGR